MSFDPKHAFSGVVHAYEVVMGNGDRAEADTIQAAIAAGQTLWLDSERAVLVADVTRDGKTDRPLLAIIRRILLEEEIKS